MNDYGIKVDAYNQILEVFREIPEVERVILFGSRARGDFKKTSDIDLAVYFKGESKKLKLIRMLEDVRCILKFDVVDMNSVVNEELKKNIKNDGKEIYNKEGM